MYFSFTIPTSVECGAGIARRTGELLSARQIGKVLIVTDAGVCRAGLLDSVIPSLLAHGIEYDVFDETEPNPSAESIMKGLARLRQTDIRCVLAIGGGSSIDTAKGIAIMGRNEGHILEYEGVGKIPNAGYPVIAIPTTAGTGSEVTASTIVTNSQTKFKTAVISPHLYPKLALLDAELTLGLPPAITAATGMDALTHAIESYTSKAASPASRALAIEAVRMIGRHIRSAYFVGDDLHSREQMLIASMMAGAAFAQSRLGNVHAISHTLGGIFNIAHGVANAALLPYVLAFNLPACPELMKDIACALDVNAADMPADAAAQAAVQAVLRLNGDLGIPRTIREIGVSLDQLPKMVEDAMRSGNVRVNPRLTRPEDIQSIIERAYHGIVE